jgi:flavin-binding protein dodecin
MPNNQYEVILKVVTSAPSFKQALNNAVNVVKTGGVLSTKVTKLRKE